MTHLSSTTSTTVTAAGRSSTLPQVQQPVQVDGAKDRAPQEPLYPPGLGFSPPLRPISRARDPGVLGDAVVEYRTGSSLLDGPLVGLGLCGVAVDGALDEAQNTRIRPAVCLGLPWPPVIGVEHVAHWPPQVALHEERMARPGLQLSMLEDLDLEAKQLMPLDLQRACVGRWCSLCARKSLDASCEVEPINPEEYVDFSFLDEDDDPQAPSRPPAPYVEEEGSDLDSVEENDTASALTDDDSASPGSPPGPAASRRGVCPMRHRWVRGDMTLASLKDLWHEGHTLDDETAAAPIGIFIKALEEAPPDPEPLWRPSKLSPVEEEREKGEEM